MGPFATQILAQMGADVIKVEGPEGDDMRRVGPMRNEDMGALFLPANHGKRSVVLDLEAPADSSRWFWPPVDHASEFGRASCRERVCQYVSISVVAVSLKTIEYQDNREDNT